MHIVTKVFTFLLMSGTDEKTKRLLFLESRKRGILKSHCIGYLLLHNTLPQDSIIEVYYNIGVGDKGWGKLDGMCQRL